MAYNPFTRAPGAVLHRLLTGCLTLLFLAISAPGLAAPADERLEDAMWQLQPQPNAIPVCYDFGCKVQTTVAISDLEWGEVSGWFYPRAKSAEQERKQIRQAIGWMEVIIGRYTPTYRDKAKDLPEGAQFPGQLDCIDESMNTTVYLRLFQQAGLLRWHKVIRRAYRRAIFDQHWSGQIMELKTGKRFVVDSWFEDNGMLPYIADSSVWGDIPFFFTSYLYNLPDS